MKPLCSLLLIFVAAPLLAALLSPWVYGGIQEHVPEVMRWVHECEATGTHAFWADIADSVFTAPFRRVTARLVLIFVLILLPLAYRLSGVRSRESFGWPRCPHRMKLLGGALVAAIFSMFVVYAVGLLMGVYRWDATGSGAEILAGVLKILIGGLLIGLLEETIFRGFILNALRTGLGAIPAIVLSSLLFAVVHFMKPVDPEVTRGWYSGFLLFSNLFAGAGDTVFLEICTLFSMGLVLATLSHWTRSVYLAIGLHTGWVWVMMLFRLLTKNQQNRVWFYGTGEWISKAWAGPLMALTVLVVVALTRKKWIALGRDSEDGEQKTEV